MNHELTLIENDVLDELINKAIKFDMGLNNTSAIYDSRKKEIERRYLEFVKDYVTIPIDLPLGVAKKMEEVFDKRTES